MSSQPILTSTKPELELEALFQQLHDQHCDSIGAAVLIAAILAPEGK